MKTHQDQCRRGAFGATACCRKVSSSAGSSPTATPPAKAMRSPKSGSKAHCTTSWRRRPASVDLGPQTVRDRARISAGDAGASMPKSPREPEMQVPGFILLLLLDVRAHIPNQPSFGSGPTGVPPRAARSRGHGLFHQSGLRGDAGLARGAARNRVLVMSKITRSLLRGAVMPAWRRRRRKPNPMQTSS